VQIIEDQMADSGEGDMMSGHDVKREAVHAKGLCQLVSTLSRQGSYMKITHHGL
jgi:hypothetical protein